MSRRNATFWSKVGEMGVGEQGTSRMADSTCMIRSRDRAGSGYRYIYAHGTG